MKNFMNPMEARFQPGRITQPEAYGGMPPIDEIIELEER